MQSWRAYLAAAGGITGIVLLGLLGISQSVRDVKTEQPQISAVVGELLPSARVGQSFVAEFSGLSSVKVLLATYGRFNQSQMVFRLRSWPNAQEDLVTLSFNAADVVDNAYHVFEFSPIRDSAGRSFSFWLEAAEASPGNAITVWGSTEDAYPGGEAILQGVEGNGVQDLAFRIEYEPSLREKGRVLAQRLAANKPSVWGDPRLYGGLAVIYLLLLFALFVRLLNADGYGQDAGKD